MFLPGYAEPILAMTAVVILGSLYGVWMVRQRQRELAEMAEEERAAEAARTPAE